jgi:hypothetical protein
MKQLLSKAKGPGAAALAAAVAIATVSPLGAFASGGTSTASGSAFGRSYEAFAMAWAEEIAADVRARMSSVDTPSEALASVADVVQATLDHISAGPSSPAPDIGSLDTGLGTDLPVLPDLPELPDPGDIGGSPSSDEEQVTTQSATDVIDALLALLTSGETQVMAALDAAEAAVLARIDNAKARAVAAFAQTDMGETETYVLGQIDYARSLVEMAFDMIRAKVHAAFVEARNKVIEELTGIDFGDAVDEVLAKIAEIKEFVDFTLGRVNDVLGDLIGGLPGTGT